MSNGYANGPNIHQMSDVSVGVYPWLYNDDRAQALGALRLLQMHSAAYA